MNNQFATQFLREDESEFSAYLDSADQLVASLKPTIDKGLAAGMSKEEILDIIDSILRLNEDGVGGGSTTGGGVTNGAAFSPGAGEQMATTKAFKGTRKKKYQEGTESTCVPVEELEAVLASFQTERTQKLRDLIAKYKNVTEDAPRLAGGKKANISAYTSIGFQKAPSAEEAGENIKGVDVEMLWKEGAEKKSLSPVAIKIIQDFTNRNIESHLRGDFKQEVAKELSSEIFNAESTINDLKRFLEDKAAFFGERYTESLNESRAYSKFKKETSIRSESERMHEAAKMINKRLEEISKLLEFTRQMREELSEGEETLEYKHNTKKVFEKINKKVIEVYSKTKKLG